MTDKLLAIVFLFAAFVAIVMVSAGYVDAYVPENSDRPTRAHLVIYDDGRTAVVEADGIDEALSLFRLTVKHERIHSVSRRTFVTAYWIPRETK